MWLILSATRLHFLIAYMRTKCEASVPVALKDLLSGHHQRCVPFKFMGFLPTFLKSLLHLHRPFYLFHLVIVVVAVATTFGPTTITALFLSPPSFCP